MFGCLWIELITHSLLGIMGSLLCYRTVPVDMRFVKIILFKKISKVYKCRIFGKTMLVICVDLYLLTNL